MACCTCRPARASGSNSTATRSRSSPSEVQVMRSAVVALALLAASPAPAADRPNVVVILADDMRPDCVGALGHPVVKTPHLDRLAREGTAFTRAVAAYPICHVSRAEILTGCTAFRCGV